MAQYSSREYWRDRYKRHAGATFDWYIPFNDVASASSPIIGLRAELLELMPARAVRVLIVGCGTSTLGECLFDEGYSKVTCVDFAEEAIETMRVRSEAAPATTDPPPLSPHGFKLRPGLRYVVADAAHLDAEFGEETFDFVFDKAMIDASFCGEDDAVQSQRVHSIVQQCWFVLRRGGKFLHVTHCQRTNGQREAVFANPLAAWSEVQMVHLPRTANDAAPPAPSQTPPLPGEFASHGHFLFALRK